ncbi:16S rRNA (cytosine(1402)-N(4))-methyltransferase, partial [bacterium]|nr:16S rRNA (cytosine(1402)-N(4))-methyltransferase [bacterium]
MSAPAHVPVLCDTSVSLLRPAPGRRFVDGTFGLGGHARRLLDAGAEVLGLDLDPDAVAACRALAVEKPSLRCRAISFRKMGEALAREGWPAVDGILLDLGVSSPQLDVPGKGFTYREDGPLDLRFDRQTGDSAAVLVARLDATALADLLWRYGEERRSRRIARAIVEAGEREPIATTARLRDVVAGVV